MKRLGISLFLLAASTASMLSTARAVVLYNNSNIQTGTGNGANGANTSVIAASSTTFGYSANGAAATASLADDFTLAGASQVSSIIVDAYSTSTYPNPPTSPFTAVTASIWSAQPGTAGAVVLFTSSTLAATAWTGIYRVQSTALTGATRPVMTLTISFPNVSLSAGTYWASYSVTGAVAPGTTASIFVPPLMNADGTLPVGNSVQSVDGGGTWAATTDTTAAQVVGVPLLVNGTVVPEPTTVTLTTLAGLATVVFARRRAARV